MSHDEQKPKPVMLYGTQYFIQAILPACSSVIELVYHQFMQKVVCVTNFERLKRPKYMYQQSVVNNYCGMIFISSCFIYSCFFFELMIGGP